MGHENEIGSKWPERELLAKARLACGLALFFAPFGCWLRI